MLHSSYRPLTKVSLPYANRQMYMHSFDIANPVMAAGYEDYLDPVMTLLDAACIKSGIAHMTVDEKVVKAGYSQRRPGPHVDGCFVPSAESWNHGSGGWLHNCNNILGESAARMPVIVASSFPGCVAWEGIFEGEPKSDGDLSHLDLGVGALLDSDTGYLFSPDCIHESICFGTDVQRTFLRIALPVDFDWSE
jgi:hypothetical protein